MAKTQDVNLLLNAFDTFKKTSLSLERYYKGLEKRIEELNLELAEKNNYLTAILESLPVGIIVAGINGGIETVNNSACAILGGGSEEFIGKKMEDVLIISNTCYRGIEGIADTEVEAVITGRDGKKKAIIFNLTTLKNLQGQKAGSLVILKDISEIKRLKESVSRDRRLAAMGEMAASLAHQIRNPLGSIELFASLLCEELSAEKKKQALSKEIIHAVRTLNNTISNMFLFIHNSRPLRRMVSVKELIDETMEIYKFLLQDNGCKIEVIHKSPQISVFVDKELLKQVLLNLIMNGVEAVRKRGGGLVSLVSKQDRDSVHILVADNGVGISEENIDRIFDPFFTTRSKGTGFGLTVVNNIVKAHQGFVEVESREGEGSTFDITLPLVDRLSVLSVNNNSPVS